VSPDNLDPPVIPDSWDLLDQAESLAIPENLDTLVEMV